MPGTKGILPSLVDEMQHAHCVQSFTIIILNGGYEFEKKKIFE